MVLTNFTKPMLDYLAREDIFPPSGPVNLHRGVRRRYSYEDVVLLRALNTICEGKGKIRHLKDALLRFRNEFGPMRPGQRLDRQLFVQGNELCVYSSVEGGRQLRSGQMTLSFVVDLSVVTAEIASCVDVEPKSQLFSLTSAAARRAEQKRQAIWEELRAARLRRMQREDRTKTGRARRNGSARRTAGAKG